jgi:hypothetical protein
MLQDGRGNPTPDNYRRFLKKQLPYFSFAKEKAASWPSDDHFARATYRACVARSLICIVRIVTPRKPQSTFRQSPRRACSGDALTLC